MGSKRFSDYYPPYVSVAQKKVKAKKTLEKLRQKNAHLKPVLVKGNKIAGTWWGIAWIKNLEQYADYSNRLGRGRSYVRNGAVLDLQIEEGKISALVQGSGRSPYKVDITIKALSRTLWKEIVSSCEGTLGSLTELLEGKFPKDLGELFTIKGKGLFPAPREISFSCSCPDWASMCKHVAAVLYGVGARLDEEPGLFFVLRTVRVDDLVSRAVASRSEKLLENTGVSSPRVMDDADLSALFGIHLGVVDDTEKKKRKSPKAQGAPKKTGKKM
jgi:uncharacterized Zn finger protein